MERCYPILGGVVEVTLAPVDNEEVVLHNNPTEDDAWLDLTLTNFTGRLLVRPTRTIQGSKAKITTGTVLMEDKGNSSSPAVGALVMSRPPDSAAANQQAKAEELEDAFDTRTAESTVGDSHVLPPLSPIDELAMIEVDELDTGSDREDMQRMDVASNDRADNGSCDYSNAISSGKEDSDTDKGLSLPALPDTIPPDGEDENEKVSSIKVRASSSPIDRLKRVTSAVVSTNLVGAVSGRKSRYSTSSKENGSPKSASQRKNASQESTDTLAEKSLAHSLSWHKLMQIYSIKKHIPHSVRQKRLEQRRAASMSVHLGQSPPQGSKQSFSPYPTRLHELCGEPDATLSELMESLETNKKAVFQKDHLGKLPLHILGDNEGLVSSFQGKQVASAFAWKLMRANPDALVTADNQGFFPFAPLISDWVEWVYDSHRKATTSHGDTSTSNSGTTASMFLFSRKATDVSVTAKMFPKPEMWDEVEWCLSMISLAMDELAGKSGTIIKEDRRDTLASNSRPMVKKVDAMRREIAAHLISAIPELLKTVLLIESEGGETRRRIMGLSVFRRMFLCKECVGDWLTHMIRRAEPVSRRAVDFLELVSDTKLKDYTGGFKSTTMEDAEHYHTERNDVFEAAKGLEGTLASLTMLENRETERAAETYVIWFLMKERLSRPFVLGLVLVDLVLHISLMIAFRNSVRIDGSVIGSIGLSSANFICVHYLIRKGCEALALLTISHSLFRKFLLNVWTMFDIVTILLTMIAFTWKESNPGVYRNGFNALVVGLLWIKVVGFLKVVNQDMSTFILALFEILLDIKYFLVVLIAIIFMFGDMFHLAVSTKDNGTFCQSESLEGPTEDFCSPNLASYLRVYSMLLGDFELTDLKDTTGITTLYVIFTGLGVVMLLNVLIAVICRSYEKATASSTRLFGRARVNFSAQNEALEIFLDPGRHPQEAFHRVASPKMFLSRLFKIFRLCTLVAILATASNTAVFLVSQAIRVLNAKRGDVINSSGFTASIMLVMFLILMVALLALVGSSLEGFMDRASPSPVYNCIGRINQCTYLIVSKLALPLFGIRAREHTENEDGDEQDNSLASAIQNTKKEMISEMAALEERLYEHMAALAVENRKEL